MRYRLTFLCLISFLAANLPICSRGAGEGGPIWLWGLPSSYGGKDIPEEVLTQANEWALEKFGATFRLTSVPEGVSNVEALNLLIAEGKFPDVAILSHDQYNLLAVQKTIADLARFGKIMSLDRYFNDEKNYPHLYRVGQLPEQMLLGTYDGKIYVAPGKGTRLDEDEPAWAEPMWAIRRDIATDHGMPKDLGQLFVTLKKIKQRESQQYTNTTGASVVPLGVYPDVGQWTSIVYQLKGAGWEVDDKMRLMPGWASQETHEALKAVNLLWREGLLHPDAFAMGADRATELAKGGSFGVTCGSSSYVSQAEAPRENVMLVPPIREPDGRIGRYVNQAPGMVVISKNCPKVAAVMKLLDWCLSREGWITTYLDAGIQAVDWAFTDAPLNWEYTASPGSNYPRPEGVQSGTWRTLKELIVEPAKVLPGLQYLSGGTEASQNRWASHSWLGKLKETGLLVAFGEDGQTEVPWDHDFNVEVGAKTISARPSYSMMVYDISPVGSGIFAAANVRWREGLYDVLSADSAVEFENRYVKLIDGLLSVGDWRAVYEQKQTIWEGWLTAHYDDRDRLQTVTPRSKWQITMGYVKSRDVRKPIRLSAETLQKIYRGLPSYQDIIFEKDITYATVDGVELKLSLARPATAEKLLPGILFLHRGFFITQERDALDRYVRIAAIRDYVAVTIDYRHPQTHQFPAQVNDSSCAVRWLRAHAGEYGVDPSRIGVVGEEMGGNVALMIGFIDESHRLYGDCGYSEYSSRVQAVVNMTGFIDFKRIYENSEGEWGTDTNMFTMQEGLERFLGGNPQEVPEQYRVASPITHVSADDPPVLSFHQIMSTMYPVEWTELLGSKLKENGIPHTILMYQRAGGGHAGGTKRLRLVPQSGADADEELGSLEDVMFAFFDEHLKGAK